MKVLLCTTHNIIGRHLDALVLGIGHFLGWFLFSLGSSFATPGRLFGFQCWLVFSCRWFVFILYCFFILFGYLFLFICLILFGNVFACRSRHSFGFALLRLAQISKQFFIIRLDYVLQSLRARYYILEGGEPDLFFLRRRREEHELSLRSLQIERVDPEITAARTLPVEAEAFDYISEQNDLFRSRVASFLVDHEARACEIDDKVTPGKNTNIEYFHFLHLLLKKAFEYVVVKIDGLGAVSVPFPEIVMKFLNFSILRNTIMELLLQGVFLALAGLAVLFLLVWRLLRHIVQADLRLRIILPHISILLVPAAAITAHPKVTRYVSSGIIVGPMVAGVVLTDEGVLVEAVHVVASLIHIEPSSMVLIAMKILL